MNEDDATQAAPQTADSSRVFHVRFTNGSHNNVKADGVRRDGEDYQLLRDGNLVLVAPAFNVQYIEEIHKSGS